MCKDEMRMLASERKMIYFEELNQNKINTKQGDRKEQWKSGRRQEKINKERQRMNNKDKEKNNDI